MNVNELINLKIIELSSNTKKDYDAKASASKTIVNTINNLNKKELEDILTGLLIKETDCREAIYEILEYDKMRNDGLNYTAEILKNYVKYQKACVELKSQINSYLNTKEITNTDLLVKFKMLEISASAIGDQKIEKQQGTLINRILKTYTQKELTKTVRMLTFKQAKCRETIKQINQYNKMRNENVISTDIITSHVFLKKQACKELLKQVRTLIRREELVM